MNCQHCEKELPEKYSASWCPFCGRDLRIESLETMGMMYSNHPFNWLGFCTVLVAPALICFVFGMISVKLFGAAIVLIAIFGGMTSGLVCTRIIMNRSDMFGFQRVIAHFFLAVALCALSYFLCFMGCAVSMSITG
jgi:hypothetical protein